VKRLFMRAMYILGDEDRSRKDRKENAIGTVKNDKDSVS
jgi:hypothetical protein